MLNRKGKAMKKATTKATERKEYAVFAAYLRKHAKPINADELEAGRKMMNLSQVVDAAARCIWAKAKKGTPLINVVLETKTWLKDHVEEVAQLPAVMKYQGNFKRIYGLSLEHLKVNAAHTETRFRKRQIQIDEKLGV